MGKRGGDTLNTLGNVLKHGGCEVDVYEHGNIYEHRDANQTKVIQ